MACVALVGDFPVSKGTGGATTGSGGAGGATTSSTTSGSTSSSATNSTTGSTTSSTTGSTTSGTTGSGGASVMLTLTVTGDASNWVCVNGAQCFAGNTCHYPFSLGATVLLQADNSSWDGWMGDCLTDPGASDGGAYGEICTLTMSSNKSESVTYPPSACSPSSGGACPGGVCQLAVCQPAPVGVAVDGSHVYWTNEWSGTVMKMGLDGSAPTTLASHQNQPHAVAVDASYVYWTTFDWGTTGGGTVMKVGLDGGTPPRSPKARTVPMGSWWTRRGSTGRTTSPPAR
jgi:hypothetical protein